MHAFVVDAYGSPGIVPAEVADPTPGPHDVLVEVRAAGINPLDTLVRQGDFTALLPYRTPFVLGHDVSGVVVRVGPEESGFAVGDEVFARPRDLRIGAFAEQIAIDADDVAHKPRSLSFAEAAAVPLVALSAWQLLVEVAAVRPGQQVLVHAGAGGLGSTVVQLARHLGLQVATTAGPANLDKVRELGAHVVVDHTSEDFTQRLSGQDLVIDSLGGDHLTRSMSVLRPGGLLISVVGPPDAAFVAQLGKPLLAPAIGLLSAKVRLRARRRGVRYAAFFMHADGARLAQLADLYDQGVLRPVLDRTFPFAETPAALAHAESGRARGKVVVVR